MRSRNFQIVVIVIACCLTLLSPAFGQETTPKPTPQQLDKLIKDLKSKDSSVRFHATEALADMGSYAIPAVHALADALTDQDRNVRWSAAEALQEIGSSDVYAVRALTKALSDDEDWQVRSHATDALGSMGSAAASAARTLAKALTDENRNVRASAADALGRMGSAAVDAIPELINALKGKDILVRSFAANALGNMSSAAARAVPMLIEVLKNKDNEGRGFAARALGNIALGNMGSADVDAVRALTEALTDKDIDVSDSATTALMLTALSMENDINKVRSPNELAKSLELWRKAQNSLDALDSKSTHDAQTLAISKKVVQNLVNAIQREQLFHVLERFEGWVSQNPGRAHLGEFVVVVVGFNALLWAVWPIGLLRINEGLKKIADATLPPPANGIKLPVSWVLGFGLLQSNKRVLNTWVRKYATKAYNQLRDEETFKQRRAYVEMPALWDGQNQSITPNALQPLFQDSRTTLLLWGEGGSGKTTLDCQMALWALAENSGGRLCETHRMLPIFIEENLMGGNLAGDALLLNIIGKRVQQFTGEAKPPSDDLLRNLLEKKRLLLIVDGLSERDTPTHNLFLSEGIALPLNALIVTSRVKEVFPTMKPQTIETRLLGVDQVAGFLQKYLKECGKPDLFTDSQLSTNLVQFYQLVGQRKITVLLARLYADYLMDAKKNPNQRLDNVPELIDAYLNELCRKVDIAPYQLHEVHEMARLIAWETVQATLTPAEAKYTDVEKALAKPRTDDTTRPYQSDPRAAITFFVDTLHLLQKQGIKEARAEPAPSLTEERFKFALDPPSEYLAARHLVVSLYRDDQSRWDEFFTNPAANPGDLKTISGFILALYETWNAFGEDGKFKTDMLAAMEKQFKFIQPAVLPGPGNLP